MVGVTPNSMTFPTSAILFRRPCWIATHDYVNINGSKYQSKYAEILDDLKQDTTITMTHTYSGSLTISIGQHNLEELGSGLPHHVYPIFDLYGKCEKISIVSNEPKNGSPINEEVSMPSAYAVTVPSISGATNNVGAEENTLAVCTEANVPQCEKADLEVHEKETDISLPANVESQAAIATASSSTSAM